MRALSIIGIIMSVGGLLTSLFVMTEAKCNCYCNDDFLSSGDNVPSEALYGSLIMMIMFIFFLVFSIVMAARSFGKESPILSQPIPPFQANPFTNYNQIYPQQNPTNPFVQQNPYNNPYQQNQQPTQPPPTNPWEPPRQ